MRCNALKKSGELCNKHAFFHVREGYDFKQADYSGLSFCSWKCVKRFCKERLNVRLG